MLYKIEWAEGKSTKSGKKQLKCTLVEPTTQNQVMDVTIWEDFPGFASLSLGSEVEGDVVPSKDPKYGPTLYPPRLPNAPRTQGTTSGRPPVVDRKKDIEAAQGRKEEGIKHSSCMRMAHETALEEEKSHLVNGEVFDETRFQGRFSFWRKFYENQWALPF